MDLHYSSRSSVRGRTERFSMTDIFKIKDYQLKDMFKNQETTDDKEARLTQTLSKVLSEENTGIIGDEADLNRRKTLFKKNDKPAPKLPPFKDSLKDALNDRILLVTACLAIFSMLTGMIDSWRNGWIEGVCILVALFIQVLITAWNDSAKDTQFVKLQNLSRDEDLPVIRGKAGSVQTLNIWDLVVGDVVLLEAGDKAPADCLFIDAVNSVVDESHFIQDEGSDSVRKERGDMLFADSFLLEGSAKVLVCAVGENSTRSEPEYDTTEKDTPLSVKLEKMGGSIKFFGLIASISILILAMVMLLITVGTIDGSTFAKKFADNLTLAFVILIVVIPEGIPMTIGISLAYSVFDMYEQDHLLIKDLEAPEKLGLINEILVGKTGTMTTEDMKVVSFYIQNGYHPNNRSDTLLKCYIQEDIIEKLKESVLFNASAYIEMNENSFYVPVGQGTEASLFRWLQGAEIPIHDIVKQKAGRVKFTMPFDSTRKFSLVAVEHPVLVDTVRIYVKGAPEVVLGQCSNHYDADGSKVPFEEHDDVKEMMKTKMTSLGHRAIAFAYKDIDVSELASMGNESWYESLTFLGLVALHDPLRVSVKDQLKAAKDLHTNVRLISGDNFDTCKAVALDTGLVARKEEFDEQDTILEGVEFRQRVGPIVQELDEDGNSVSRVRDEQAFNLIMDNLKVLARATPEDKLLVTVGLKAREGTRVAVIGEGINDVAAFKEASVSFAMGSGASLARNNASVVLTSNDFESVMRAIMWGRNIYTNMQRFLVFQMTSNISIVLTLIIGYIYLTESPLNAVQLIWVNLIMDILGSIALASTKPTTKDATEVIDEKQLMKRHHYRQIYGNAIWSFLMMTFVIFGRKMLWDLEYLRSVQTTCVEDDCIEDAENKVLHFSLIWNTFIMLMWFNMLNSRDVSAKGGNPFSGLITNWKMSLILVIIFVVQAASIFTWIGGVFESASLEKEESKYFTLSIMIGATILLSNMLQKYMPRGLVDKMPQLAEDKSFGSDSKLMQAYEKQAQAKALPVKGAKVPTKDADVEGAGDDSFDKQL